MSNKGFTFEDPPRPSSGGKKGGESKYLPAAMLEACRAHPGKWARPSVQLTTQGTVSSIRRTLSYHPGRWEAATRGKVLYVRYLGDDQ